MIDLEAVDGNLLTELIQQRCIKANKSFSPSRMSDETYGSTTMSCINDNSNVVGYKIATSTSDDLPWRHFSRSITMSFQERNQFMGLLRAWFL